MAPFFGWIGISRISNPAGFSCVVSLCQIGFAFPAVMVEGTVKQTQRLRFVCVCLAAQRVLSEFRIVRVSGYKCLKTIGSMATLI